MNISWEDSLGCAEGGRSDSKNSVTVRWKHTYLCSDHLVPGEFCILRSVQKTRTSFWPHSRRISLKPFRQRVFCLPPLQMIVKRTVAWLKQNNHRAMKTTVKTLDLVPIFPWTNSFFGSTRVRHLTKMQISPYGFLSTHPPFLPKDSLTALLLHS